MKILGRQFRAISFALVVMLLVAGMPIYAQQSTEGNVSTEEAAVASVAAPTVEKVAWADKLPELTVEQKAKLEAGLKRSRPAGPKNSSSESQAESAIAGPSAGTESAEASAADSSKAPLAPGDPQLYRNVGFGGVIPSGYKSNVMESSVGNGGKYVFYTGNWFAARSTNGGTSWSYVNSYSGFSDFCCDQVTTYDNARDMYIWLRQGVPNASGVNQFKLGISTNNASSFCTYSNSPSNVNSGWTGLWWDYPHIQLGADNLYIAYNLFNANDDWVRSVVLRWPLDSLRSCAAFNYNYFSTASWFTTVPVQGADHVMYFASNWPTTSPFTSRISIWKWPENSTSTTNVVRSVAAWSATDRDTNRAVCGSTSGNWTGRTDHRLLSGARYMIHSTNLNVPGRKIVGWWWNVKQGGNFARPYVDGAAFYEDTLTQVGGAQGRPYVWSSSVCFAYPSVAANVRGDLGITINYAQSSDSYKPRVAYIIADDYVTAPPGFTYYGVVNSNARPSDNKWGDYNTTRMFQPGQKTWIGAAHYIPGSSNCATCAAPVYFAFGRSRDYYNWARWQNN